MDGTAGRICVEDHAVDIFGVTRRRLGDAAECTVTVAASGCIGKPRNFTDLVAKTATSACHTVGVDFARNEMFWKFLRDEHGATAIEYSLIAGFIALAIIYAVGMTGQRLVELFESLLPALSR